MGVWDHTTFGNDDACDWAGDLQSYQDLTFIDALNNWTYER
jgi:hypothetical protein